MAMVRRYWKTLLLVQAVLALLAAGGLYYLANRAAQAQVVGGGGTSVPAPAPAAVSLDVPSYLQLQQLRRELALTTTDLAALGCTQATSQQVLTRLGAWYQAHRDPLQQAESQHQAAGRDLQEMVRLIHMGPRDAARLGQVAGLQQRLQAARQQRQALVASAVPEIGAVLTARQQVLWAAARDQPGLVGPGRYAQPRTPPAAGTGGKGATAGARTEEWTLTQQADVQEASRNLAQYGTEVARAEAQVLPLPAALQRPVGTRPAPLPGASPR